MAQGTLKQQHRNSEKFYLGSATKVFLNFFLKLSPVENLTQVTPGVLHLFLSTFFGGGGGREDTLLFCSPSF